MPVLQPPDQRSGRGRRDDHSRHQPRSAYNSCVPAPRGGYNTAGEEMPPETPVALSVAPALISPSKL